MRPPEGTWSFSPSPNVLRCLDELQRNFRLQAQFSNTSHTGSPLSTEHCTSGEAGELCSDPGPDPVCGWSHRNTRDFRDKNRHIFYLALKLYLTASQQTNARFPVGERNTQAPCSSAASPELLWEGHRGHKSPIRLDQGPLLQTEAGCCCCSGWVS